MIDTKWGNYQALKIKKSYFYALLLGYTIFLFFAYWKIQQDDAYIIYNYAKHIAEGNGYVFNIGEKINATTSPLYTLYLAVLCYISHTADLLPLIAHISGAVFLFCTAILLFKITDKPGLFPVQYFLPLLYLTNPLIRNAIGLETSLTMFLVVLALYYYLKENNILFALIAGLSFLSRFDSILFFFVIVLHYYYKTKSTGVIKIILVFLFTTLPWFIFSYFYFGELLPSSVKIKVLQQTTGYWGTGLTFFKGILTQFPGGIAVALVYIISFFLTIVYLFIKKSAQIPKEIYLPFIWMILYFLIYSFILNPPAYSWYFTPLSLLFGFSISLLLKEVYMKLQGISVQILLIMIFSFGMILPLRTITGLTTPKYTAYKEVAAWINNNSSHAVIAYDEIGVLGFYLHNGTVRDVLGLVNPKAVEFLMQKDFAGFVKYYHPEYIVADYPEMAEYFRNNYGDEFQKEYSCAKICSTGVKKNIIFKKKI